MAGFLRPFRTGPATHAAVAVPDMRGEEAGPLIQPWVGWPGAAVAGGAFITLAATLASIGTVPVAGITLFLVMVGVSKLALGTWHDSVVENEA